MHIYRIMFILVTIALVSMLVVQHTVVFAKRSDSTLIVSQNKTLSTSIDHIGMTDLLATINTLYLNGYYNLIGKYIEEYKKKQYPLTKEILYFTAISSINAKKYDDALNTLYIAVTLEPRYSRALNAIGYVYAMRRQWQQSLSHLLLAHRANTYNAFISYNIALVHYTNINYAHAAAWACKAIDDKPNFARACDVYACSMFKQQKYEEAVEYWNRALQLGLDEDRVYFNRACAYMALQNFNACSADCATVIKKNNKHFEALMLMAYAYFLKGDYDASLRACNSGLKIKSNDIFAKVLGALNVAKKNAQAGKDMLVAALGPVENVEDVGVRLLQYFQYTIVDPPAEFLLY